MTRRRTSRRILTGSGWRCFDGYSLLSRFKFSNDVNSGQAGNQPGLDFSTEQEILRVNMSRGICCHVGGQIDFDSEGNLFLSTGDDTNPFQSAGYTPIDDRATRNPAFDARRTSGNTNDLRGKLLRIRLMDEDAIEDDQIRVAGARTGSRRGTCSGETRR